MVYKNTTAPLVEDVLKGYNAAVFAYGATGSGKTHTMLGPCRKKGASPTTDADDSGLMVRAIEDIFHHVEMTKEPNSCKVNLQICSLYNRITLLIPSPFTSRFPYHIWKSTTS